eukprot:g30626.t1
MGSVYTILLKLFTGTRAAPTFHVPLVREPEETPNNQPTVPTTSEQEKVGTVEGKQGWWNTTSWDGKRIISENPLLGFVDSDFAGDKVSRKSREQVDWKLGDKGSSIGPRQGEG